MGQSVLELKQQRTELLEKVEAIQQKAQDAGRDINGDEAAAANRILDDLASLDVSLGLEEAAERQRRATAIEQIQGGRPLRQSHERLTFRDAATGRLVQALGPGDRLSAEQQSNAGEAGIAGHVAPAVHAGTGAAWSAKNEPRFGEWLASRVTGRPYGRESLAQIGGDDISGGALLPSPIGSQVIDLARAPAVSITLGAQTLPMTAAEISLVRVDQDPTSHWRAEAQPVEASEMAFGRITLRPKTLAAVVPISIELMEDAPNAPQLIESSIGAAMALQLDRAALRGQGAENEPRGISNHPTVNTVTAVGTPADYSSVTSAVGKIVRANFNGDASSLGWVMSPRDAETYDGLRDTTNQPLQPTPWAAALQRAPTNSMPADLGAGSDESEMIVGDFSQVLIGVRTGITIRVLDSGEVTDSSGVR